MNTQLRKNNSEKVIFLFGATAVGKTDLLCSFFCPGFEVVNADSVQIYRGLDIGSAKADSTITAKIPHHLIDILDPWQNYNVADFIESADSACADIRSRGNIPIISGGTAYYFKNFLYGLSDAPKADLKVREEVNSWIAEVGKEKAYSYLQEVDSVSAQKININDSYRISRAIEVFRTCNKPLSSFKVPDTPRNNMDVLKIGLYREKEVLRKRIEQRVDIMFNAGLVDEIRKLLALGANLSWQSMQAIGYREFLTALDIVKDFNLLDLNEIKQQIVMNSIHYAKRQMTFFRSFSDVLWVQPDNTEQISKAVQTFLSDRSNFIPL